MEEMTVEIIQKLKEAESKEQMLDIVTQKLQKLIKKFEDRIFTTYTPGREYLQDKSAKEEIRFIKSGLEGNWISETQHHEKFKLIKQQVEQVSYRFS